MFQHPSFQVSYSDTCNRIPVHANFPIKFVPWYIQFHSKYSVTSEATWSNGNANYGMYFVSKCNALNFNGKDRDYRECNGFKVSTLVHWIILQSHCWILQQTSFKCWESVEFIPVFVSLNWLLLLFWASLNSRFCNFIELYYCSTENLCFHQIASPEVPPRPPCSALSCMCKTQCQDLVPCKNDNRKHFKPCCKHMHATCKVTEKKCRQAYFSS